ncbi:MAG TPA: hypothetical protein VFV67_19985 [Actinophytocola sp.]|uniref:hypothetical protein n=1 Tax=Actinophytocola sp. TaxID=1872138 RepID=UPI002DBBE00D|nr:hypothetical protein [Actinophytocola sp.]HEU5472931.1 hypothetical protein [Actinophytocola sp.]
MPQQLNHDRARSGGSPPGRHVRAIAATLAAGLTALLLSGSAPHVATGQADTRVVPPMYRMMYVPDDQDRRISEAREVLVTNCMAAHGLSYATHVEDITEAEALAALQPFGLESLDDLTTEPAPAEPVHSEEYARVLFGDPDQRMVARGERLEISSPGTGCLADAEYRLLGDQRQRASELRLRLYDGERDARERLDRDPAFLAATQRWRTCVNRFGIDAANPGDLLDKLPDDVVAATDPALRADLRCKRETGYLDTAYARLAELQDDWLTAHADLTGEWLALRQRQDHVARQVLGPR